MKPKALIVYAVILAILGVFYYLYDVRLAQKQSQLQDAQTKIFEVTFDQIGGLRLVVSGTEMNLVKDGPDQWRLTAPLSTPADRWSVEGLVRAAIDGKKDRVFSDPVSNPAEYGLDKPEITLSLLDTTFKSLGPALNIGQPNPMGQLYYARSGQSREVYTVTASYRQELAKTLFDLRDKALVLTSGEKIDGLRFLGKNELELTKKGLRHWDFVKPVSGPADDEELEKIVYRALKGRVKEFIPAGKPDAEYGFDAPRGRIQVLSGGQVTAEVIVGRAKEKAAAGDTGRKEVEGYYARSTERQEVMVVTEEMATALDRSYEELRDRHVMNLDSRTLTGLTITQGQSKLAAKKVPVKETEMWEVTEPANAKSQDRQVDNFLRTIEELKFVHDMEPSPANLEKYGLDHPDLKIELTGADGAKHALDAVLKPVEDKFLAVRSGEGRVFLIGRNEFMGALPEEVRPAPPTTSKPETSAPKPPEAGLAPPVVPPPAETKDKKDENAGGSK